MARNQTYLCQDTQGNLAYIEHAGELPYNVMLGTDVIFCCSTGQFKKNRTRVSLSSLSLTAPTASLQQDDKGNPVRFVTQSGFDSNRISQEEGRKRQYSVDMSSVKQTVPFVGTLPTQQVSKVLGRSINCRTGRLVSETVLPKIR